jgi:hypothetical protein
MAVINKTGITNGGTIQAEHITRAIDALSGGTTDTIIATGSFSGSLTGSATSASYATTATTAQGVDLTNTTTGTGPYYPVFSSTTSTGAILRTDSSTFTYNATTNTLTVTASYALNGGSGGDSEYMTLRLTAERTDTNSTTYYVGANGYSNGIDRTGVVVPFKCIIVSASTYTNTSVTSVDPSTITPTLYKNTTGTPAIAVSFSSLDLEAFIDSNTAAVNSAVNAGNWLCLKVDEDADSTCTYTITCDVLVKKVE